MLHTKLWFGLNLGVRRPFGALARGFRLVRWGGFGAEPAGVTGAGGVGGVLVELGWPSLGARRDSL